VTYRRPHDPPFVRRSPPPVAPLHLRPVRWRERAVAVTAVVVGLVLALGLAWFVLVVLRRPDAVHPSDRVGERVDHLVSRTILADRVLAVTQWFATVAAVLVLGGLIFRALVLGPVRRRALAGPGPASRAAWRRRQRVSSHRYRAEEGVLRRAALVGMVAGAVGLLVRTATLSDSSLFTTIVPSRVNFVITSPFGVATMLRSAGLALAGSGPSDRRSSLAGGLAILGSFVVVGHPQATASTFSLLTLAQVVHVTVVATWFGGVTFLALDLRHRRGVGDPRGSALVVGRFSVVAGASVVLAGLTGTVLAWSQIDHVATLWETAYGRALMIKVACVGMVAAIGGYNHRFLVPAVERDDGVTAWRRLRRTATAESLIICLGVLVATAAMTSGGL
jgi:putative copper export protein